MKKQDMIDYLVDAHIEFVQQGINEGDAWLLDQYLRNGFKGFANYTRKELKDEFNGIKEQ